MILSVVKYGHPALRQPGAPIPKVTPEIATLVADMLETMHAAKGIGLAAQQVARPLQLTVIDVRDVPDRPSTLRLGGESVPVSEFMPLVLINPEVAGSEPRVSGPEGCLSFPEIYADIVRPEWAQVTGLNAKGQRIEFEAGGLLARVIQHEVDHLQGILFIDRMDRTTKAQLRLDLEALQAATKAELQNATKPALR